MRIRLKTRMAGPGGNWAPGDVIEVDENVGREMAADGFAEIVAEDDDAPVEMAAKPPAEAAVTPRGRRKRA